MFERHIQNGKTIELTAPAGMHDDHANSDVLALWAGKTVNNAYKGTGGEGWDFLGSKVSMTNR
jgi:hypothetical protein